MKRLYLLFLACLMFILVACGGTEAPAPAENTASESPATEAESEAAAPAESAAPAEEAASAESAGEAIVRIGWAGSPDTLNPGTAVLSEAYTLFELVYDSMYQLQPDGTYTLELADSVDVSDDGTVWTFHIRDGITFHDGEPLTAADIAYSYNLYKNTEDFPFLPVYTEFFDTIEAPDDSTVVITLTEAIPNMESQLIFLYVVPEHIWGDKEGAALSEFENEAMIGSGPFKMKEYKQNEFVQLEAVKDHYLNPPKIDGAIFQTFENQDALVQAVRTGQVDMITEMPNTAFASLAMPKTSPLSAGHHSPPASPTSSSTKPRPKTAHPTMAFAPAIPPCSTATSAWPWPTPPTSSKSLT